MHFDSGKGSVVVLLSSIEAVYVGAEVTQSGGTVGTITKVAVPYGGGRASSVFSRTSPSALSIARMVRPIHSRTSIQVDGPLGS